MPRISYAVTAVMPDSETRDRYLRWLLDGHVRDVLDAGASDAQIIVIDQPELPIRVQTRYVFESQQELDRYLRDRAPELRAQGLRLFGPETGVAFTREIGVVVEHG